MVPFVSPAPIENFSTDSLFPAFNLMSTTTCLPTSPLSLSKEALISNNTNSHSLTHHPNYFTTKQQPSSTSSFHPVFTSSRATSTSTSSLLKKSLSPFKSNSSITLCSHSFTSASTHSISSCSLSKTHSSGLYPPAWIEDWVYQTQNNILLKRIVDSNSKYPSTLKSEIIMDNSNVNDMNSRPSIWSGFYKKALQERQVQLKLSFPHLFATSASISNKDHSYSNSETPSASPPLSPSFVVKDKSFNLSSSGSSLNNSGFLNQSVHNEDNSFPIRGLNERIADNMVENCIGTMGLPVGLALNFVIDGVPTVIPMSVEEPSVIAAVSGAAKLLSSGSDMGIITQNPSQNIITAQLLVLDLPDDRIQDTVKCILEKKNNIITFANQFCLNMYKRGGGVVDLLVRTIPKRKDPKDSMYQEFLKSSNLDQEHTTYLSSSWFVVHLLIDVCDAMGANCASTVAEGTSTLISDLTKARVAIRIVTNLNPNRMSKATFKVPVSKLNYKGFSGPQVAARILEAYHWAKDDVFRATTHNKGIMNGIDAVALATGQDWRAVEAACHSWAAGSGQRVKSFETNLEDKPTSECSKYTSLTHYWIEKTVDGTDTWLFCGELELPLIVGTKGGVLSTAPLYSYTLGMMGFPDSKRLAAIMCCVGLCQNFAALRALTTEGIQRGHMHLHARNIATAAGAPPHAISEVTQWMIEKGRIQLDAAKEYITAHHLYTNLFKKLKAPNESTTFQQKPPSMFYFRESKDKPLTLNIAFQTLGDAPVYLDFTESIEAHPVHAVLLGGKTYDWIMRTFPVLDAIKLPLLHPSDHQRANEFLCKRFKVLSLILNALLRRLMIWCPEETRRFVDKIFSHTRSSIKQRTNVDMSSSMKRSPNFQTSSKSKYHFEKRPSIMKHVHSVINQASKYRSTSLTHFPLISTATMALLSNVTNELSVPKPNSNSPYRSFSPGSSTPPSPRPLSPLGSSPTTPSSPNFSSSGSSSSADLSTPHGELGWMPDPHFFTGIDWILPDSGIFRLDIFEDELQLKDPIKDEEYLEDEGLGESTPPTTHHGPADSETHVPTLSKSSKHILGSNESMLLSNIPTKRQILRIGLPLVLSIWQVFELWVTQYVGTTALASSILDEQRVIVSSLVATHNDIAPDKAPFLAYDTQSTANLSEEEIQVLFMKSFHVQTKRAQCSLFLLIDLIGLDPNTITLPLLTSVKAAGFYLEQEATVAHDIARLTRDYRAVFGPDNPTAELVSIPVTRSPQSPQLQFRRRSLNRLEKQLEIPNPGDELIELHTQGICNSVLTYALLRSHLSLSQDESAMTQMKQKIKKKNGECISLAEVSDCLHEYLNVLSMDSLRNKLGREISMVLTQSKRSDVTVLNQEYLSSMASLFRQEFKVTHCFQGN